MRRPEGGYLARSSSYPDFDLLLFLKSPLNTNVRTGTLSWRRVGVGGKELRLRGLPQPGRLLLWLPSSWRRGEDLDLYEIARKLSTVKHILIVMSGKGGVGKSTVASQLARYIAHASPEANVGLLDVDICGPSIPKAMGAGRPIFVEDNLAVMSCGFLLTSPDDAVIWRGPKKNGIIKQFLRDVDWSTGAGAGDQGLDYLIIDTPPGTSDEHISLVSYLKHVTGLRGAILVTTPQEVAQADVRKQVDFCGRVKLPIIGVVENMAVFTCPKCHQDSYIFKRSTAAADSGKLLGGEKVKLLGRIPLDPLIGKSVDEGVSLFEAVERRKKEAEVIKPQIKPPPRRLPPSRRSGKMCKRSSSQSDKTGELLCKNDSEKEDMALCIM
ncbi:Cytosolic Fe-S cluster assembly factor nubp1 [Tyrophagus putrescentiae]|nr:Cytosolic Fe-S cluster assembly factor nubp1 [Tyrophagus putrescentiae]